MAKRLYPYKFRLLKKHWIGSAIFFVISVVVIWIVNSHKTNVNTTHVPETAWEALQSEWDSVQTAYLSKTPKIYPFNPNFLSDYRAYNLGLSLEEYQRLKKFRDNNQYVNSVADFQKVTQISDSLLLVLKPYIKFPEWTQKAKSNTQKYAYKNFTSVSKSLININEASKEELMKIRGIGDKISDNILQLKQKLGAFVSLDQLKELYGINEEVFLLLNQNFKVEFEDSQLKKYHLNQLSMNELSKFHYFDYKIAKQIVVFRSHHKTIQIEDLTKINDISKEKLEFIKLYLDF